MVLLVSISTKDVTKMILLY